MYYLSCLLRYHYLKCDIFGEKGGRFRGVGE